MLVCHTCDNRRCVNPAHLVAGTHSYNTRDAVSKGRWTHMRKLSPEQIQTIRSRKASARELAARFGVHESTVYNVLKERFYVGAQ